MKFRILIGIPLACAAAFLLGDFILFGKPGYDTFIRVEIELVKGMALIGNLAAALKFGRGEYLRRAWLFTGGCMFILLLRDLTLMPCFETLPFRLEYLRGGLSVLANLSAVIGTILLARAWRVAGLELPGSKWRLRLVLVVAMLIGTMGFQRTSEAIKTSPSLNLLK